jgi:hypothetical protein
MANVTTMGHRVAPDCLNLSYDGLTRFDLTACDRDGSAGSGEPERHFTTETSASARDQDDFAFHIDDVMAHEFFSGVPRYGVADDRIAGCECGPDRRSRAERRMSARLPALI